VLYLSYALRIIDSEVADECMWGAECTEIGAAINYEVDTNYMKASNIEDGNSLSYKINWEWVADHCPAVFGAINNSCPPTP